LQKFYEMKRILIILMVFFGLSIFAQTKKNINLNEGNISEKFDAIYNKSSNYQDYKVIKRGLITQLKKQVLDSLQKQRMAFAKANDNIIQLQKKIDQQSQEITGLQQNITNLQAEKDQISFLGFPVGKLKYQIIMWSLVTLLALGLLFFIFKFKNSNQITQTAKKNLEKLEEEYDAFRSKSLEREQLLKRQLLDEKKKYQA